MEKRRQTVENYFSFILETAFIIFPVKRDVSSETISLYSLSGGRGGGGEIKICPRNSICISYEPTCHKRRVISVHGGYINRQAKTDISDCSHVPIFDCHVDQNYRFRC